MIIVTPEQMKYLEAEADRNGNTYEMLMEKAGERLAEKIISIINIEKNKDKNHIFDKIKSAEKRGFSGELIWECF